jgi:hypothetical protein
MAKKIEAEGFLQSTAGVSYPQCSVFKYFAENIRATIPDILNWGPGILI